MTCAEKLRMDHPEWTVSQIVGALSVDCPSDFKYLDDPEIIDEECSIDCEDCWNREIPEEPKEEPKLIYAHTNTDTIADDERSDNAKPVIKDSGNRREFESGAVRDMQEGKGRMDLLPWAAIMEVSKHCENGAKKYGEHNVDRGIPTHSLCDSAARHLAKYLDGWTDEPHLLAAAWNLLWAIQMEVKHKEMVDTPWKKNEDTINTPQE